MSKKTYKIDISKIKEGDIILFHTKGLNPISNGIRFLTGSYWNHVGIIDTITPTVKTLIEAQGKIVRNSLNKYTDNKNYDLKIVRVKTEAFKNADEKRTAILNAVLKALSLVGDSYDYFAIVFLGLKYIIRGIINKIPLLRKIPSLNSNLLENRYKFFCSELVCACFHGTSSRYKNIFAGEKHKNQKCNTITPGDINKSKNTYFVTGLDKD